MLESAKAGFLRALGCHVKVPHIDATLFIQNGYNYSLSTAHVCDERNSNCRDENGNMKDSLSPPWFFKEVCSRLTYALFGLRNRIFCPMLYGPHLQSNKSLKNVFVFHVFHVPRVQASTPG